MYTKWVCPRNVGVLGVSDRDVAAHSLDVPLTMPMAECCHQVSKWPLPLGVEIQGLWDPLHCHTSLTQCLQRGFVELVSMIGITHFFWQDGDWSVLVLWNGGLPRGRSGSRKAILRQKQFRGNELVSLRCLKDDQI